MWWSVFKFILNIQLKGALWEANHHPTLPPSTTMSESHSDSSLSSSTISVIIVMMIFLLLVMSTVGITVWAMRDSLPQQPDDWITFSPLWFAHSEISEQSEEELREISPESHSSNAWLYLQTTSVICYAYITVYHSVYTVFGPWSVEELGGMYHSPCSSSPPFNLERIYSVLPPVYPSTIWYIIIPRPTSGTLMYRLGDGWWQWMMCWILGFYHIIQLLYHPSDDGRPTSVNGEWWRMLSTRSYTSFLNCGLSEDKVLTSLAMLLEVISSYLILWAFNAFLIFLAYILLIPYSCLIFSDCWVAISRGDV